MVNNITCYIINERIYFRQKDIPSKKQLLKIMGVKKNTFAGNMISRIYDYYFHGAITLRKEYNKYYRNEFSSLAKFIQERYNIESDKAEEFAAEGNYSIKDYSMYSLDKNIIATFKCDENFINAFYKAIGGVEIEDSNGIYYK